jgi:hypothetical protein
VPRSRISGAVNAGLPIVPSGAACPLTKRNPRLRLQRSRRRTLCQRRPNGSPVPCRIPLPHSLARPPTTLRTKTTRQQGTPRTGRRLCGQGRWEVTRGALAAAARTCGRQWCDLGERRAHGAQQWRRQTGHVGRRQGQGRRSPPRPRRRCCSCRLSRQMGQAAARCTPLPPRAPSLPPPRPPPETPRASPRRCPLHVMAVARRRTCICLGHHDEDRWT